MSRNGTKDKKRSRKTPVSQSDSCHSGTARTTPDPSVKIKGSRRTETVSKDRADEVETLRKFGGPTAGTTPPDPESRPQWFRLASEVHIVKDSF